MKTVICVPYQCTVYITSGHNTSELCSPWYVRSGPGCLLKSWDLKYLPSGIEKNMVHNNSWTGRTRMSALFVSCHAVVRVKWSILMLNAKESYKRCISGNGDDAKIMAVTNDLSTTRPKWRLDGPALSGHLLYSLVNHDYGNHYHHHLVR